MIGHVADVITQRNQLHACVCMATAILTHVYVGMNDTYIDECTGMFALRLALSFAYVGALARLRVFLRLCPAFTRACAMMSHMHSHRSNGCHAMDDP